MRLPTFGRCCKASMCAHVSNFKNILCPHVVYLWLVWPTDLVPLKMWRFLRCIRHLRPRGCLFIGKVIEWSDFRFFPHLAEIARGTWQSRSFSCSVVFDVFCTLILLANAITLYIYVSPCQWINSFSPHHTKGKRSHGEGAGTPEFCPWSLLSFFREVTAWLHIDQSTDDRFGLDSILIFIDALSNSLLSGEKFWWTVKPKSSHLAWRLRRVLLFSLFPIIYEKDF